VRIPHSERNTMRRQWAEFDAAMAALDADIAKIGKRRWEDEPLEIRELAARAVATQAEDNRRRAAMTPDEFAADDAARIQAAVDFICDTSFGGP
jgi:hypothetical protein